jgi:5-(carboxyamino)imidazole ribonucleotide synthase
MATAFPLPPGATIGILGSGQLGRMLAIAAARLGFRVHVYDDASGPASDVAATQTVASFDDPVALAAFADAVDVVTYEFENVPVAAVGHITATGRIVRPGARALEVAQDRLVEKTFISGLGIPVAPFAAVDAATIAEAARIMTDWRGPAILKTRRFGYDGKGQISVGETAGLAAAWDELGKAAAVLEQRLLFACEVSVLVVRGADGVTACYDVPENEHGGGILRVSRVPSRLTREESREACELACRIAAALDYVGVLGVELFYMGSTAGSAARFLVNEIAPRVHNSGHWTMDACAIDQFENHIRAVAGWPLGSTARHSNVSMHNLIGAEVNAWPELAAEPGAILHIYGKRDARPGRKMGHVNRLSPR